MLKGCCSQRFLLIWVVSLMGPCGALLKDRTLSHRHVGFVSYPRKSINERILQQSDSITTHAFTPKPSIVFHRRNKVSPILNMVSPILQPPQLRRMLLGSTIAYKLASGGYKKRSLNKSGAIAAYIVASVAFSCSFRSGMTLLAFYATGSKLTKLGSDIKGKIEKDYATSKGRGAKQVLACSLVAVICSVLRRLWVGTDAGLYFLQSSSSGGGVSLLGNQLTLAYVAFFACCAGDTWASELGVLSKSKPRLITMPWKAVVPGTNGGVSLLGLVASALGGACIGLCHAVFLFRSIKTDILALIVVGGLSGLGGSLLDSLLGAVAQATYYDSKLNTIVKNPGSNEVENRGGWPIFSNEMVNVISTIVTALLAAKWAEPLVSLLSVC